MRFLIFINQQGIQHYSQINEIDYLNRTDFTDWVIIGAIYSLLYSESPKIKRKEIDGKKYVWVNYQSLLNDNPMLKIKTRAGVCRRIYKLEKLGLIERVSEIKNKRFSTVYLRLSDICLKILRYDNRDEIIIDEPARELPKESDKQLAEVVEEVAQTAQDFLNKRKNGHNGKKISEQLEEKWQEIQQDPNTVKPPIPKTKTIAEIVYDKLIDEIKKAEEEGKLSAPVEENKPETQIDFPEQNQETQDTQKTENSTTGDLPDVYEIYKQLYPKRLIIPSIDASYLKMIKDIIESGKLDRDTIESLLSFWTAKEPPLKSLYRMFKEAVEKAEKGPFNPEFVKPDKNIILRRNDPIWIWAKKQYGLTDDDFALLIVNNHPWFPEYWMTEMDFKIGIKLIEKGTNQKIQTEIGILWVYPKQRQSVEFIYRTKL